MQTLVRHIHKDRKGREELDERVLTDPVITVGHGSGQAIQLRDPAVAQRHLELKPMEGGRFRFRAVGGAEPVVDRKSGSRRILKPGDRLELGEQTIAVAEPETDFDAVLEVTTVEREQRVGAATHHRIDLSQTSLGIRRPAWILLVAILLLFLGVPLAGHLWPEIGDQLRRNPLLPSDHLWSSGPLANVHHTPEIGSDCQACHLELFERAPDRGCMDCHADVSGHVDRTRVSVPLLEAKRCATCHREHHEPPDLVRDDSGLCADCHRRPERHAAALGDERLPRPVSGFSETAHPEFRLALLRPAPGGDWLLERVPHSSNTPAESSNLKFPHDLHLDPTKVESLRTGRPLDCASCHVLADDGEHFDAITMEDACQDCHSLSFDDDFPRKQLPHGDVETVLVALEEHYIRKHADPDLRGGVRERGRRRPGRSEDAEQCQGTALECGRQLALQEAINQFSRSGCVTCHEVTSDPARPFLERWQVREVRLVDDWYPYSRFDHVAHLTRSRERMDGESACGSCHAAQTSNVSADVLIPGRENCLQCHGPEGARETSVALSCRGCHDFHLPFRGAMKASGDGTASRAGVAATHLEGGYDHE